MARCEDFPCCGHERGCCPDYDDEGNQTNMKCTCGATVPLTSRYSLCEACLRSDDDYEHFYGYDDYDAELAQDQMLERQEMEDFEGLNSPFEDRDCENFFDGDY